MSFSFFRSPFLYITKGLHRTLQCWMSPEVGEPEAKRDWSTVLANVAGLVAVLDPASPNSETCGDHKATTTWKHPISETGHLKILQV